VAADAPAAAWPCSLTKINICHHNSFPNHRFHATTRCRVCASEMDTQFVIYMQTSICKGRYRQGKRIKRFSNLKIFDRIY